MNKINSLTDYISKIQKISQEHSQRYVFRGQSNCNWPLSSSAARRIRKTLFKTKNERFPVSQDLLLEYNQRIINDYYLKGINRNNNSDLSELEILSDLQHFGAATCLVDFSLNSLVALYFACISDREKSSDGAVFTINISNYDNYSPLQYTLLKEKIDFFLNQTPKIYRGPPELDEFITDYEGKEHRYNKGDIEIPPKNWFWEAPHINQRIPIQQSIFLFGKSDLKYDDLLIIPSSIKVTLLKELNDHFNINEETLFPDFFGYSKNNEVSKDYKYWSFGTRLKATCECLKNSEQIDFDLILDEIKKIDPSRLFSNSNELIYIFTHEEKLIVLKNLINEFINEYPKNPEFYLFMSEICESLGKKEERKDWLEKCQDVAQELKDDDLLWHCQDLLEFSDIEK